MDKRARIQYFKIKNIIKKKYINFIPNFNEFENKDNLCDVKINITLEF